MFRRLFRPSTTRVAALLAVPALLAAVVVAGPPAGAATGHRLDLAILQSDWQVSHAGGPGAGKPAHGDLDIVGRAHAVVTCLVVTGNDAVITAKVDLSFDPLIPIGSLIVGEAVDNGSSGDLWRASFPGAIHRTSGGCWGPTVAPVPVADGYVTVT